MIDVAGLARTPLFEGLEITQLEEVARRARERTYAPGDELCAAGNPADRCWVITAGLIDLFSQSGAAAAGEVVARRRKGGTVGEVAVLLGEPHAETAVASIPTTALEFSSEDVAALSRQFPQILVNALRNEHGQLANVRVRSAEHQLGETVALAAGRSLRRTVSSVLSAAQAASPRPVTALDRRFSFAGAVTAADDLVTSHATVVMPVELDTETVTALLREADRVVALAGTASEVAQLGAVHRAEGVEGDVEVVLVGREAIHASAAWPTDAPLRAVRSCEAGHGLSLQGADLAWLARHLTRTKLGIALGAGGAKGYAHLGALQVLEEAGFVIDYVAGSSIGAIVAACLGLGWSAGEIDKKLRDAFDPANVAEIFKTSLAGRASGLELMRKLLRELTEERNFADTVIPVTVMSVSLTERAPMPIRDGPLWEALLAATALAGLFPPHERQGQRLVDGLALVPVPTSAVIQDGADVTVAVNLIGRETLKSWPGAPPPEPPPERRRRGVLDDLLEVMDLSQLDDSVRHAELADVVITPRFGPGEWRDFHLAAQFLAAGRAAAERQLPELGRLVKAAGLDNKTNEEGGGVDRTDPIRV